MQFIMRSGFFLSLYFMIEYVFTVWSTHHIFLSLVHVPMMFLTVVLLFLLMRPIRLFFADEGLSGLRAWTYGVQLMFFAGLLEALFVYIYNTWLYPDNLFEMHSAVISQYRQAIDMMQQANAEQTMPSLMQICLFSPLLSLWSKHRNWPTTMHYGTACVASSSMSMRFTMSFQQACLILRVSVTLFVWYIVVVLGTLGI